MKKGPPGTRTTLSLASFEWRPIYIIDKAHGASADDDQL